MKNGQDFLCPTKLCPFPNELCHPGHVYCVVDDVVNDCDCDENVGGAGVQCLAVVCYYYCCCCFGFVAVRFVGTCLFRVVVVFVVSAAATKNTVGVVQAAL